MKKKAFIIKLIVFVIATIAFAIVAVTNLADISYLRANRNIDEAPGIADTIKALEVITLVWLLAYGAVLFSVDLGLNLFVANDVKQRRLNVIILFIEIIVSILFIIIFFVNASNTAFYHVAFVAIIAYLIGLMATKTFLSWHVKKREMGTIQKTGT